MIDIVDKTLSHPLLREIGIVPGGLYEFTQTAPGWVKVLWKKAERIPELKMVEPSGYMMDVPYGEPFMIVSLEYLADDGHHRRDCIFRIIYKDMVGFIENNVPILTLTLQLVKNEPT